jgi:hypothetical protein
VRAGLHYVSWQKILGSNVGRIREVLRVDDEGLMTQNIHRPNLLIVLHNQDDTFGSKTKRRNSVQFLFLGRALLST